MTSIVLAGGKSIRLGRNKAFELLEGENLVSRTVHRLSSLSSEVIVVTAQDCQDLQISPQLAVKRTADLYPGCGPLAGIHSGLSVAASLHSLVVACDMPFLNLSLLEYQMKLAPGFDVVIPSLDGRVEPLHAVYSKNCLPHIERILADGCRSILDLVDRVNVRYVERAEIEWFDPDGLSFINLNTEADFQKARDLIRQGS